MSSTKHMSNPRNPRHRGRWHGDWDEIDEDTRRWADEEQTFRVRRRLSKRELRRRDGQRWDHWQQDR